MPLQKTGTTSICKYLETHLEAHLFKDYDICKSIDASQEYSDGYFKHWLHLPKKFKNFYVFTTIRNPYRRFISLYAERLLYKPTKKSVNMSGFYDYARKNSFANDSFCKLLNLDIKSLYCDINPPKDCVSYKINSFIKLEDLNSFYDLPFIKHKLKIECLRVSNSNSRYKLLPEIAEKIKNCMYDDFCVFDYPLTVPNDLWLKCFL